MEETYDPPHEAFVVGHRHHGEREHDRLAREVEVLWSRYWTLSANFGRLSARLARAERTLMTQQDEINADVAALGDVRTRLQTEIDTLEAQVEANQPVDLSGLKQVVSDFAGMVPADPTPAPADPGTGDVPASGDSGTGSDVLPPAGDGSAPAESA